MKKLFPHPLPPNNPIERGGCTLRDAIIDAILETAESISNRSGPSGESDTYPAIGGSAPSPGLGIIVNSRHRSCKLERNHKVSEDEIKSDGIVAPLLDLQSSRAAKSTETGIGPWLPGCLQRNGAVPGKPGRIGAGMAARTTRRTSRNGNLEAAMAMLIQNQAQFLIHLAETRKTFDRIEKDLDAIKAVLVRQEGILEKLPEAIHE